MTDAVPAGTVDDPVASAYKQNPRRRRKFRNKLRQREKDRLGGADEDYNYYDRDDEYGAPKAPSSSYDAPSQGYEAPSSSYNAPAPSYDAPSYQAPSYHAPSYDSHGGYGGGGDKYGLNGLKGPDQKGGSKDGAGPAANNLKASFSSGYGVSSGYGGHGHS